MTTLSDEILVAYADDELPPAKRAAVERRLAHDAEARDRLATFTSTGQWLARAYDDSLRAAPPEALVRAIREAAGPPAAAAESAPSTEMPSGKPFSFWERLRTLGSGFVGLGRGGPWLGGLGVGVAAGVALMLLLPGTEPTGLGEAAFIARTLETATSGEPRELEIAGELVEVTPIGTVETAAGSFCREFTETRIAGAATPRVAHGIACRSTAPDAAAAWRTVARIDLTPNGTEAAGFALASGDEQQLFEALLAALGATRVLTPDEERQRLGEGWR